MIKLARKLEIAQAGKLQAGSGELEFTSQELELSWPAGNISWKLEISWKNPRKKPRDIWRGEIPAAHSLRRKSWKWAPRKIYFFLKKNIPFYYSIDLKNCQIKIY